MIILCIFVISGCAVLLLMLKGKYDAYIEPLEKEEYPLKQLLPISLWIMEKIKYKYTLSYDRRIRYKIVQIHGLKYAQFYLKIHYANKLSLFLLGIIILSGFGTIIGPDLGFGVFSGILLGALFYFSDSTLNNTIKKRQFAMQLDFPDFLNKLTLLINAGLTVGRAWEKAVLENKKECPLYNELSFTLSEIKSGKAEMTAYEDFAKRCRTPEITKFVSVVLQNLRKGNTELVSILRLQAGTCWEMRKHTAKRLGEEASTKMLLPMMIMFLAILIIVSVPAILALQGI